MNTVKKGEARSNICLKRYAEIFMRCGGCVVFKKCGSDEADHGLINYTKAKCRQLKKN